MFHGDWSSQQLKECEERFEQNEIPINRKYLHADRRQVGPMQTQVHLDSRYIVADVLEGKYKRFENHPELVTSS